MEQRSVQVLVLGGGPGGYSCALRAAQLGLDVMLVERDRPGGTCLHAGCIPSKALIHAAERYRDSSGHGHLAEMGIVELSARLDWAQTQSWKDGIVQRLAGGVAGLLRKAGVQVLQAEAEMRDGKRCTLSAAGALSVAAGSSSVAAGSSSVAAGASQNEGQDDAGLAEPIEVIAEHVVLALGATEVALPGLPASESVMYARQLLALDTLPGSLAVVGGGYIGLELGQAFARLGVAVTVVEAQSQILPAYPASLTKPVEQALLADGVTLQTGSMVERYDTERGELIAQSSQGATHKIVADKVLVAVGRRANLAGWGCENLALDIADGFVAVDARCETSMADVYAVGDLTGEPLLAHKAMAQGQVVAESIAGRRRVFAPVAIPAVCFTSPEIVLVGETADSARQQNLPVIVQRYPLSANGRALTLGPGAGFVEVVADADTHALLGVQAVGEHVAELAHSFTLALEMGARLEDIADTIHAHPTIGETFAEASAAALGLPLHA